MVNEKRSAARPGLLWVLVRKFFMDVLKNPGLLAICLFPVLFLLVCRLVIVSPLEHDDARLFLLVFGMLFSTSMVPGTTIIYPLAEAREKRTLRTLTLAGVGRAQLIAAHGIVGALYTALVAAGCFIVSGEALDSMLPFMLITVLASGPLIALSLALGLASRNQMAAYFFSLPVILVSFAPMFCMYSEAAFQALPLLLSGGGFALVYALAEGTLLAPASILPAVAQLAWIVASLIALVMVAPGIPRDDQ
ncbi:hypothetical protein [Eggerthella lenta]|uniref:hypothetical protein n=1 Tax=Eggerthella lenta TaxID=84112 RepID=UPI000DF73E75|nr:hypothetical protein [Eggerthella lenta]RDC05912.1 hypothetical protein C1863_07005 [Eggerthella lenta]